MNDNHDYVEEEPRLKRKFPFKTFPLCAGIDITLLLMFKNLKHFMVFYI